MDSTIKHGVKPIPFKDSRTYDWHRTFGTASVMPTEFDFDAKLTNRNQNADGFPEACTAYTQTDCATDEDKLIYEPPFTYSKTLLIDGAEPGSPCTIQGSMKSGVVYGMQIKGENDLDALSHHRAPYFIVRKNGDYFGGILSALWVKQGSLSMATPWFPSFSLTGKDGIVPQTNFNVPKNLLWSPAFPGHNYKICGTKLINGIQYLKAKPWIGPTFGDNGFCYFSRDQVNTLLSIDGAGCFGQKHADPKDIKTVEMNVIELLISLYNRLIQKLISMPTQAPNVVPEASQPLPQPPMTSKLVLWARAIETYEGANKAWNNPGACRGVDGTFLKFKTYEEGFNYLCDYLTRAATGKHKAYPKGGETSLLEFQKIYSPSTDNNNPLKYAQFIASRLQVDTSTPIKLLI